MNTRGSNLDDGDPDYSAALEITVKAKHVLANNVALRTETKHSIPMTARLAGPVSTVWVTSIFYAPEHASELLRASIGRLVATLEEYKAQAGEVAALLGKPENRDWAEASFETREDFPDVRATLQHPDLQPITTALDAVMGRGGWSL